MDSTLDSSLNYLIATCIGEKSEMMKCATFLHVAGDEVLKVFNTVFDEDVDGFDRLKYMFKAYCEPRKNFTYLRHVIFNKVQGPNETLDAYVTDRKNKPKDCKFAQLTNVLIKDCVVCGIIND